MKKIYRFYKDTEVSVLATEIECPHCGEEWMEDNANDPGTTYDIECEVCEKEFKMYFDCD